MNRKAVVQLAGAVLAAGLPALLTDDMHWVNWVNFLLLGIGAFQVWNAANLQTYPYAKMYESIAVSVAAALTMFLSVYLADNSMSPADWIQVAVAAVTPAGVYSVRNSPSAVRHGGA